MREPSGCLPFAEWMGHAHFDPERGYYAKRVRGIGRRGDFTTSAVQGTLLGEAVAGWLKLQWAEGAPRAVIEVGGGDGSLSSTVRHALGWWQCRKLGWHMVETSPPLQGLQQQRLGSRGVRWHLRIQDALDACSGKALIFHNELLDALPVTLLQWNAVAGAWQEVWLRQEWKRWREELRGLPACTPRASGCDPSAWPAPGLREGQRIEVPTGAMAWFRELAAHWKAGAMLMIDYGDLFPQLYHRRPRGTLRAYWQQQVLSGPEVYANMGHQDITADVNFSDLTAAAHDLGWQTGFFMTQREFITGHVPRADARALRTEADRFLLNPAGAGKAFKVMAVRPCIGHGPA